MRRIGLAVVLAVTVPLASLVSEAQQPRKVPRIAFITTTSPGGSPTTDAFRTGLRDLGYIEGQNLIIEWRWGRGTTQRFTEFAADVVGRNVDVIVAANSLAGHAVQKATTSIPVIIPTMADPVGDGFVRTLARPGGNITGFAFQLPELEGKRMQLLKEAVPSASRIALILDVSDRSYESLAKEAETAAQTLGMRPHIVVGARTANELNAAFSRFASVKLDAVFIVGGTMLYNNRTQLAELALKSHLPMMCEAREHAEAGCLMSYAASLSDLFRRAAGLVDKILKGATPADLPMEQPNKFELVINIKTANALGLTIPQTLLARADQIIE
jgi:putative ABC transport system substrate-binding protein